MTQGTDARLAIIGGGIAGLSAAATLSHAGHDVTLFEKSRGLGGRLSQRRIDGHGFDLGAQYATARSEPFQSHLKQLAEACQPWLPSLYSRRTGSLHPVQDQETRWIGAPAMQTLARSIDLGRTQVQLGVRIESVAQEGDGLRLIDTAAGVHGPFHRVVCATPPAQAAQLLVNFPDAVTLANQVTMHACLAAALLFEGPIETPIDACFADGETLLWAAREGSKSGRSHSGWTVHAAPAWSQAHWDHSDSDLLAWLAQALGQQLEVDHLPQLRCGHIQRWRYAQAGEPLQLGSWISTDQRLLLAGDWLNGNRVEGAYLSGLDAAARCLDALDS